jgi:tetratricopeptide (TPR) repeat protein
MAVVTVSADESTHTTNARPARGSAQALLLALLLFSATLALYRQVRHFDFIEDYDDGAYVTQNQHVKSGLTWETVTWAFTDFWAGNRDPLTWLSHALDAQLYYLDSGLHHQTSVTLHALSAVVLFWLLWRATGYLGRSLTVAALFALHPMNVESAAWIAERKNVLSMLFFLLALGAYRWYARRPAAGRYAVVALLYACSLMSKAQIITFPCILLLWDYWPLRRMFAEERERYPGTQDTDAIPPRGLPWLILEKVPLLVLSVAGAVLTVKANVAGGTMSGARNSYPLLLRLENAIISYPRYIAKLFWPSHLAVVYPYPKVLFPTLAVLAALLFVVGVTVAVFVVRHRARYPLVGWLWYLGTLVPMLGVVQVGSHPMADRFTYVPFIGLFIMICWSVADLYSGAPESPPSRSPVWIAIPTAAVLVILAMVSYRQLGYWQDSLTLWSHAIAVTANNDDAEDKLGSALVARGREKIAMAHFRAAVTINPDDPMINVHAGFADQSEGNPRGAIAHYEKALQLTQGDIVNTAALRFDALKNMGIAYRDLGDMARARECFAAAADLERQYRK